MALSKIDLTTYVKETFEETWQSRNGQVVPDPKALGLGNDTIVFDRATVLYADISGSTAMVDKSYWFFAAEVYKNFLYCAARLITDSGGTITAYDGDRIMGIFIGDDQTPSAVKCAFKINYATKAIIVPAMKAKYTTDFNLQHVVGIDTSQIRVARTGSRGFTDLVWVGRAANYAAKLTELSAYYSTWITQAAFDKLDQSTWYGADKKTVMWAHAPWPAMNNAKVYGSTWWWEIV